MPRQNRDVNLEKRHVNSKAVSLFAILLSEAALSHFANKDILSIKNIELYMTQLNHIIFMKEKFYKNIRLIFAQNLRID